MSSHATRNVPIPVILDTDIGGDIDDTWALAMLLKSPELDIKLVTTCTGNTAYRAKVVGKMLEIAGRTDIPIGIGISQDSVKTGPQAEWVAGYDLAKYPGKVYEDGVGALVRTIVEAPKPVTLIGIGPVPNLAAALERDPRVGTMARFVGMYGNIRKPYGSATAAVPEYNVKIDVPGSRQVFAAPWDMTITPLDTCGFVVLKGERYARVRDCKDPLVAALIENYRAWGRALKRDAETKSSVLFDTVAVYLAFTDELLKMEQLPLRIEDDGFTRVMPAGQGKLVNTATEWKDLEAFEEFLVKRLIENPITPAR